MSRFMLHKMKIDWGIYLKKIRRTNLPHQKSTLELQMSATVLYIWTTVQQHPPHVLSSIIKYLISLTFQNLKVQMFLQILELTMAYICELYNNREKRKFITPVPFARFQTHSPSWIFLLIKLKLIRKLLKKGKKKRKVCHLMVYLVCPY